MEILFQKQIIITNLINSIMKKIFYYLFLLPFAVNSQTITENFVKTTVYKTPTTTTISSPNITQANTNIVYLDGFGRTIQEIANKQSNSGNNVVKHIEYDVLGRQSKNFLNYSTSTNGLDYESTSSNDLNNYYNVAEYDSTVNPYSEVKFQSLLNQINEISNPGTDWNMSSNHTIRMVHKNNVTQDNVINYKAKSTWNSATNVYDVAITNAGFYSSYTLFKTTLKNENWVSGKENTTEEFTDFNGRLILKRIYGVSMIDGVETSTTHDTYFVYDQFGNLSYTIPPLVDTSITLTSTILDNLCYQYKYDYRNRLVEKRIPGKQWEYIVYDKLDRVVANGPVNSPFTSPLGIGWMIKKYDYLDRNILTAWLPASTIDSSTRYMLQVLYNKNELPVNEIKSAASVVTGSGSFLVRYTNNAIPPEYKTVFHVLTLNYYDDYTTNITFSPVISYTSSVTPQPVYYNNSTLKPKGLPTISWTRVLQTSSLFNAEKSYTLYDDKSRVVRYFKNNYQGGYTQIDSQLETMTGRVNYTLTTHKLNTSSTVTTLRDDFTYTDQDRLLTHVHKINTLSSQLLTKNSYNELGVLTSKKVGGQDITGTSYLQKVDYKYNIRGWLSGINDVQNLSVGSDPLDLFSFKISYNKVDSSDYTSTPLYNGNISETHWKTSTDNILRKYTYDYDSMHRLKNAVYTLPEVTLPVVNSYDESLKYDKNGNIKTLKRNGNVDAVNPAVIIDDLVYDYEANSNKLIKVTDNPSTATSGFLDGANLANEYFYDTTHGDLIADKNKGIQSITYNHLNLPTKIIFSSGNYIDYLYTANGIKVAKTVKEGSIVTNTDYLDGFQYVKIGSGSVILENFPHSEGYVSNDLKYVFQYRDHLGNIRLSYSDTNENGAISSTEILEESHYYPFGLKHSGYNTNINSINSALKYRYNGKELQNELGLNMYDYGARNYDPTLGRWMNIDPLAEISRNWSPYTYAINNPVYFIDTDGRQASSPIFDSKTGKYLGSDNLGFMRGEVLFMSSEKYKALSKNGTISHDVAIKKENSIAISRLANTSHNLMLFNSATDFISKVVYKAFYGVDPTKELAGGKVYTDSRKMGEATPGAFFLDGDEFAEYRSSGGNKARIVNNFDMRRTLNTAGNIASNFEHEFRGHGGKTILNIPVGRSSSYYGFYAHKAIYEMQMESEIFEYTDGDYREHLIDRNEYYDDWENGEDGGDSKDSDSDYDKVSQSPRYY